MTTIGLCVRISLLAEQNPQERGAEREDHQQVAVQSGFALRCRSAMAAENDQSRADGGRDQCSPSDAIETFAGKEGSGDSEQYRHGSDHQRCVADGGVREAVKLDKELDGNAEDGGDEKDANFTAGETHAVQKRHGQQADAGKEKPIEHHMFDAHLIEREAAEVETGAPEASGDRACAVAEKGGARAQCFVFGHACFYCRTAGTRHYMIGCT